MMSSWAAQAWCVAAIAIHAFLLQGCSDCEEFHYPDLTAIVNKTEGLVTPAITSCLSPCADSKHSWLDRAPAPECTTFFGQSPCVPDSGSTATGRECVGGAGYGMECGYWGTEWQLLWEWFYNTFDRYSWCYTGDGNAWDYCVPQNPQIFPNWVGSAPCLPWKDVAADPLANFTLLTYGACQAGKQVHQVDQTMVIWEYGPLISTGRMGQNGTWGTSQTGRSAQCLCIFH